MTAAQRGGTMNEEPIMTNINYGGSGEGCNTTNQSNSGAGEPVAWQKRPTFGNLRIWTTVSEFAEDHEFWRAQEYEIRPLYSSPVLSTDGVAQAVGDPVAWHWRRKNDVGGFGEWHVTKDKPGGEVYDLSPLVGSSTNQPAPAPHTAIDWPEPKITNPDIADPTGVPYIDSLIHRLLDAQQDINLEANERMSQSLCDASALVDEVETALRRLAAPAPHAEVREALEFYADPTRYSGPNSRLEGEPDKYQPENLYYRLDVTRDGGSIARKALSLLQSTGDAA